MLTTLWITALMMGLAGGPHCLVMCGAACAGIGRAAGPRSNLAMAGFLTGRLLGYSLLGAVVAASVQGMGWLGANTPALRPLWTLMNSVALVLGLMLLVRARQPAWITRLATQAWQRLRPLSARLGAYSPVVLGMLWALLPCGLLYSALLVAALSSDVWQGAAVMALFALGSGVTLMVGPWLWLRLRGSSDGAKLTPAGGMEGHWGVRLAGLALCVSASWALIMGPAVDSVWCAVP